MTPPRSVITAVVQSRYFGDARRRRGIIAIAIAICALLTFFPQKYRASTTMNPTDPASLGLSGALGQFAAANGVFGNQAAVEIALKVARGVFVREIAIKKLDLSKRIGFQSKIATDRWLQKQLDVRSLRGGILQIDCINTDPDLALDIVSAVGSATRERLTVIGQQQTEYKRKILTKLLEDASIRLSAAQLAYDTFRRRTRYAQPGSAISAIGERIPALQADIKAKEVELNAARQFGTDENLLVRQIIAELQALRRQLAEAQALNVNSKDSVGSVVVESTQVRELERKLGIARSLYDNYTRFLEGTSVEDLTQNAVVRELEPPYVDPARQYNLVPAMFGFLLLAIGLAIEFYLWRPPVGNRSE